LSIQRIKEIFRSMQDKEACFHFRYRTHGAIGQEQSHPFKVLDKETNGVDMYFMHNGTVSTLKATDLLKDESDTQAFNRLILNPILRENPDFVKNQAFHKLLREYVGSGSKLCFMYGDGEIVKINSEGGDTRAECWVSNLYSFNRTHRDPPAKTSYWEREKEKYNNTTYYSTYQKQRQQQQQITSNVVSLLNNNNNTKQTNTKKQAVMFEQQVQEGSLVYVFQPEDPQYVQDGKITSITPCGKTVIVKFPTTTGGYIQFLRFSTETGESEEIGTNEKGRYFIYPVDSFTTNTVQETGGVTTSSASSEKKPFVPDELPFIPDDPKVEEEEEKVDEQKEEKEEDVQDVVKEESIKDEFYVQASGGLTVDSKNRYGAGAFNGTSTNDLGLEYGGVTIGDFFAMTPQERFDFFIDDFENSFNMFQDVVEYLVLEDEGLYPEDGDIDFVDPEEDDEEGG